MPGELCRSELVRIVPSLCMPVCVFSSAWLLPTASLPLSPPWLLLAITDWLQLSPTRQLPLPSEKGAAPTKVCEGGHGAMVSTLALKSEPGVKHSMSGLVKGT